MTSPDDLSGPPGSPARWWAAVVVVALAVGAVLVVTWPAGGMETADDDIARIRFGETVSGHRFEITVRGASYATIDPAPAFGDPQPGRFLALDLDVENVHRLPADTNDLVRALFVTVSPGGRELDRFGDILKALVVRDKGTNRTQLHSRLREKVRLVYRVPDGIPAPTTVAITVRDEDFGPGFSTDISSWLPADDLATYTGGVT